jgi:hypothetical protein
MEDTAIALDELRTLEEFVRDNASILTPSTVRYQLRNRHSNGLADATVKVGKRLLIIPSRYAKWLGGRAGAA